MSTNKLTFMIAAAASVVIVREGARVTVAAGTGADFNDAEIAAINKAHPGALRRPVNESRAVVAEAEAAEAPAAEAKTTGKGKKAKPVTASSDDDEDI